MRNTIVDLRGYESGYFGGVRRFAIDLPVAIYKSGKIKLTFVVKCQRVKNQLIDRGIDSEEIFVHWRYRDRRFIYAFLAVFDYYLKSTTFTELYFRTFGKENCKIVESKVVYIPTSSLNSYSKNCHYVISPHDLQHEVIPKNFRLVERIYRYGKYRFSLKVAKVIQISSGTILNEFLRQVPKIEGKCVVIPEFSSYYSEIDRPKTPKINANINLFYPAQFWPHKNHSRLFEIIELFNNSSELHCVVHLTGNDFGRMDHFRHYKFIEFYGIVADDKICELYRSCHATILPTLYESSSLVFLESVSFGTPVIYNSIDVLIEMADEISGNYRFDFQSGRIDEFQQIVKRIEQEASVGLPNKFTLKSVVNLFENVLRN